MTEVKRKASTPFHTFGSALRVARKEKGVRLCELAAELDVSVPFLSDVEKGRRPLSDERIRKAAKRLGVDLMPLLELATRDRGKIVLEFGKKVDPKLLRAITLLSMNWPALSQASVNQLLAVFKVA
jgi:transcriptional regulator with XRE-family HTH domain